MTKITDFCIAQCKIQNDLTFNPPEYKRLSPRIL